MRRYRAILASSAAVRKTPAGRAMVFSNRSGGENSRFYGKSNQTSCGYYSVSRCSVGYRQWMTGNLLWLLQPGARWAGQGSEANGKVPLQLLCLPECQCQIYGGVCALRSTVVNSWTCVGPIWE